LQLPPGLFVEAVAVGVSGIPVILPLLHQVEQPIFIVGFDELNDQRRDGVAPHALLAGIPLVVEPFVGQKDFFANIRGVGVGGSHVLGQIGQPFYPNCR